MQFRFKALQRMREPDELDTVILLAKPRGWIAAFVVLIVVAGACVWAFTGQIPRTLTATGLLTHPLGVSQLQTMYAGQVSQLSVAPQERVTAGETVMTVTDQAGQKHSVVSPFTGTVISVATAAGQVVTVAPPSSPWSAPTRRKTSCWPWSSSPPTRPSAYGREMRWTSPCRAIRRRCSACCADGSYR